MSAVDLEQLQDELRAAGIPVPNGIGTVDSALENVHTYEDGFPVPLPPEAQPIVDRHVPIPPITKYTNNIQAFAKVRTTNAVATELFRQTLQQFTGYDVVARFIAVDAGNGAVKKVVMDFTVKRLGGGVLQVGTTAYPVNQADTAAGSWTGGLVFDGSDLVIMVTGAANRTIDWAMLANVNRFTPGGDV